MNQAEQRRYNEHKQYSSPNQRSKHEKTKEATPHGSQTSRVGAKTS